MEVNLPGPVVEAIDRKLQRDASSGGSAANPFGSPAQDLQGISIEEKVAEKASKYRGVTSNLSRAELRSLFGIRLPVT